ncbi:hypothetical protein AURDEDRAFT_161178 [Auricularia subglabra TFB-10046 SS5]|nr:hypothetical protein AURDEDRAFT_161178 [Auricularia subglabra TFB-10046 SS5]
MNFKVAALLALAPAAALATGLVSATAYSSTECSSSNVLASFAETLACVATPGAQALSIDASTAGCQVFLFADDACTSSAYITHVNLSEKCHNTDAFNSVKIQCIQGGRR